MRTSADKKKFLEALRDNPIITLAARRAGISKASIFRWKKNDPDFARQLIESQEEGRLQYNDICEGQLIKLAQEGDRRAAEFWLRHNHIRYYIPRPTQFEPDAPVPPEKVKVTIVHTRDSTIKSYVGGVEQTYPEPEVWDKEISEEEEDERIRRANQGNRKGTNDTA